MKFKIDKKYLAWGLTALIVTILSISFVYLIFNGTILLTNLKKIVHICMPIIDGFVIAYLLAPIVNFIEKNCLTPLYIRCKVNIDKKTKARMRTFSICFTMLFVFLLIYGFISIVIPQLYRSIQNIVISFPTYVNNVIALVEKILAKYPDLESNVTDLIETYSKEMNSWINSKLLPGMNEIIKSLSLSVLSFFVSLWNLIIGLIISIYVLASKEKFLGQAKKLIYSIFNTEHANNVLSDFRFINKTFGGFVSGKLVDSLIIGIICFICLSIIGTPYPVLISVIVGVTNIIPFFGPYLGAIPSAILILLISPIQCLYFLIFVLILQQFDGNFLGPKILGNSTGLSSGFWVIFSITIFGGLFGVLGMLLGVPTFAVIYAFIRRKINSKLEEKGLPYATKSYINLETVNENNELVMYPPETHHSSVDTISLKDINVDALKEKVKSIHERDNKFLAFFKKIAAWLKKLFHRE